MKKSWKWNHENSQSHGLPTTPSQTHLRLPSWAFPKACIGSKLRVAFGQEMRASLLFTLTSLWNENTKHKGTGMVLREDCNLGDLTHAAIASSMEAEAPGGVLGLSPFATDLERVTGSS